MLFIRWEWSPDDKIWIFFFQAISQWADALRWKDANIFIFSVVGRVLSNQKKFREVTASDHEQYTENNLILIL